MENLGARIRKERRAIGLTIEGLAKLVGTSTATIQRVETGSKSPSVALLAEISNVLRKPIDELIREERKPFYKLSSNDHEVLDTGNFKLSVVCPFGLISRDIVINFFEAKAGSVVKPHQDNGYEWVYIIKGSCVFHYDGESHKLKKGDAIFYDARKTHSVDILTALGSLDIFLRS